MNELVSIPIGWILSRIGGLGAILATLAGIIYSSLNARLAEQNRIIEKLQGDFDRMARGCGVREFLWRER